MSDSSTLYLQALNRRLDAEAAAVMPLALAGHFDQAEKAILAIDRDVYGQLAAARMYISLISALGGAVADQKDLALIRLMFDRAVELREGAYPMPHTEEESQRYQEGSSQDRGRVVSEIGFDPYAQTT